MAVEIKRVTELGNPKPVGIGGICVVYGDLRIEFASPRGFGDEKYAAIIKPDRFSHLARAMMKVNAGEAMRAFGDALKRGIPEPLDPMKRWRPELEDEKAP